MGETLKAATIRIFSIAVLAFGTFLFAAPALAGTADNVAGWAWAGSGAVGGTQGGGIGWISMNCTDLGTCGTVNYGVTFNETPGFNDRADLSGYAWSERVGWICFGATCAGTTPEGAASYAQYRGSWNAKTDQIYGWAQILNQAPEGWISLNCDKDVGADACATSNYFLTLNNANGNFTKGVINDHFAWGKASTGIGAGWVDFSAVTTGWVRADLGTVTRPSGVFEPSNPSLPGTHLSTFDVGFANFSAAVGSFLECELLLPDLSRKQLNKLLPSVVRNGSQTLSYTVTAGDAVQANKIWYVDRCRIASAQTGAACAADSDCSAAGGICDESVGKCRRVLYSSTDRKPVYTHGNTWSGLNASEDQYAAIRCNAGFTDAYFKNAAQCDYTADASFALAMRRGIPIEGNCNDGIDNDGNGQADCNGAGALPPDRYCTGVSYLCPGKTLPRTSCVYGLAGDGILDCNDPSYVPQSGELCCTKQPQSSGSSINNVVNGLECTYGDANDGYFDCTCAAGGYGTGDCYAPGATTGDLCCDSTSKVIVK